MAHCTDCKYNNPKYWIEGSPTAEFIEPRCRGCNKRRSISVVSFPLPLLFSGSITNILLIEFHFQPHRFQPRCLEKETTGVIIGRHAYHPKSSIDRITRGRNPDSRIYRNYQQQTRSARCFSTWHSSGSWEAGVAGDWIGGEGNPVQS